MFIYIKYSNPFKQKIKLNVLVIKKGKTSGNGKFQKCLTGFSI